MLVRAEFCGVLVRAKLITYQQLQQRRYQKHCLLRSLSKIFSNNGSTDAAQMLVEVYLNYDCDAEATAKENICERMINALSKITSQHDVESSSIEQPLIQCYVNNGHGTPALTINNLVSLS